VWALDAIRRCRDGLGRGEAQSKIVGAIVTTLSGFILREAHSGTVTTAVQSMATVREATLLFIIKNRLYNLFKC
jgi:hypothetical protein